MKTNIFLTVTSFIAGFALMTSCNLEKRKGNSTSSIVPKKPEQTITYGEAKRLEKEFVRTRGNFINEFLSKKKGEPFMDTREFWFSLDVLKQYIEYVEYEGKKQGYRDLGVRVYWGVYPDEQGYHDPGYSTVFLYPTTGKENIVPDSTQQASILPNLNTMTLETIEALNFSHGGKPPKGL